MYKSKSVKILSALALSASIVSAPASVSFAQSNGDIIASTIKVGDVVTLNQVVDGTYDVSYQVTADGVVQPYSQLDKTAKLIVKNGVSKLTVDFTIGGYISAMQFYGADAVTVKTEGATQYFEVVLQNASGNIPLTTTTRGGVHENQLEILELKAVSIDETIPEIEEGLKVGDIVDLANIKDGSYTVPLTFFYNGNEDTKLNGSIKSPATLLVKQGKPYLQFELTELPEGGQGAKGLLFKGLAVTEVEGADGKIVYQLPISKETKSINFDTDMTYGMTHAYVAQLGKATVTSTQSPNLPKEIVKEVDEEIVDETTYLTEKEVKNIKNGVYSLPVSYVDGNNSPVMAFKFFTNSSAGLVVKEGKKILQVGVLKDDSILKVVINGAEPTAVNTIDGYNIYEVEVESVSQDVSISVTASRQGKESVTSATVKMDATKVQFISNLVTPPTPEETEEEVKEEEDVKGELPQPQVGDVISLSDVKANGQYRIPFVMYYDGEVNNQFDSLLINPASLIMKDGQLYLQVALKNTEFVTTFTIHADGVNVVEGVEGYTTYLVPITNTTTELKVSALMYYGMTHDLVMKLTTNQVTVVSLDQITIPKEDNTGVIPGNNSSNGDDLSNNEEDNLTYDPTDDEMKALSEKEEAKNPKTFDGTKIGFLLSLLAASGYMLIRRRKKEEEEAI